MLWTTKPYKVTTEQQQNYNKAHTKISVMESVVLLQNYDVDHQITELNFLHKSSSPYLSQEENMDASGADFAAV